jgi:hypothetical protein
LSQEKELKEGVKRRRREGVFEEMKSREGVKKGYLKR